MRWYRIYGLIWRDYKVFLRSRWRWLEFFYYPVTSLIIWGLFAVWTAELASFAGTIALVINIFWSYTYVVQSTINLSINEDSWSSMGSQLLVTGLGKFEYISARVLFSLLVSSANLLVMLLIAQFLFYDVFLVLIPFLVFAAIAAYLSVSLAILISGLIFLLGQAYTWLAWAALQLFVLLSFPFSPPEILPAGLQIIARGMPFTTLFQGVRSLVLNRPWLSHVADALLVGTVYLLFSLIVYTFGFERSRKTGKLARMF